MASAGTYTLQYDVASAGAFRRAPRVTSAPSDPGDPTSDRSPNLVNFQYEIHPHRPPTQTFPRARDLPRAPRFVARPAVSTVTTANMSTAVWTRHTHSNGRCWCECRVTWRYTSCFDESLGDGLNSVSSTILIWVRFREISGDLIRDPPTISTFPPNVAPRLGGVLPGVDPLGPWGG